MSFAEIFDVWYKIVHWCWFWVHSIGLSLWHTFAIKCTGFCSCSRVGALIFYQGDLWGGENPEWNVLADSWGESENQGGEFLYQGAPGTANLPSSPMPFILLYTFAANFSHPATPLFISEQDQVKPKFSCLWEQFAPNFNTCLCHKTF